MVYSLSYAQRITEEWRMTASANRRKQIHEQVVIIKVGVGHNRVRLQLHQVTECELQNKMDVAVGRS